MQYQEFDQGHRMFLQKVIHVYLNKFEITVTHPFLYRLVYIQKCAITTKIAVNFIHLFRMCFSPREMEGFPWNHLKILHKLSKHVLLVDKAFQLDMHILKAT